MMTPVECREDAGRARYTYRLRVSSTARAGLMAEWARCRWIWNECVAVSPRDKNSARVMLVRAGLNPAGAEGGRPPGALLPQTA